MSDNWKNHSSNPDGRYLIYKHENKFYTKKELLPLDTSMTQKELVDYHRMVENQIYETIKLLKELEIEKERTYYSSLKNLKVKCESVYVMALTYFANLGYKFTFDDDVFFVYNRHLYESDIKEGEKLGYDCRIVDYREITYLLGILPIKDNGLKGYDFYKPKELKFECQLLENKVIHFKRLPKYKKNVWDVDKECYVGVDKLDFVCSIRFLDDRHDDSYLDVYIHNGKYKIFGNKSKRELEAVIEDNLFYVNRSLNYDDVKKSVLSEIKRKITKKE